MQDILHAPHRVVDARDPGQVAETVAGVVDQVPVVGTGHQRHGDTVGELGEEPDHLVVLLGRQDADLAETEDAPEILAPLDRLGGVLVGRGDDVVGSAGQSIASP